MSPRSVENPGWAAIVRDRLRELDLPAGQESKVVEELAQLLDDASRDVEFDSTADLDSWVDQQISEWGDLADLLQSRQRPYKSKPQFAAPPQGRPSRARWMGVENARYAFRRMLKKPAFTAIAILSLAIGVGANTAVFSIVNSILLRTVELEDPSRLVNLYMSTPDSEYFGFSTPAYEDVVEGASEIFSGTVASHFVVGQTERDGELESLVGEVVTGNFFDVLGLDVHLGRPLLPEDDIARGAHPVVLLGFSYWQQSYGSDPRVVGETLRLSGRPFEIVGVAPESYPSDVKGFAADFVASRMMADLIEGNPNDRMQSRGVHVNRVKARLRPGVSLVEAQTVLDGIADHTREQEFEDWHPQTSFDVVPTSQVILTPRVDPWVRATATLLMVVVGLVLLLACTNLAGFLLAQAFDRRKEISLRLALGATRRNLVSQLLTESLLLAAISGIAGIGLAVVLLRLLPLVEIPVPMRLELDLSLDPVVLTYTVAITLIAGLTLGLAPALQSTRPDLIATLREEEAGGGRPGKLRLRNALIAVQVAISTVLLVGAGLFLRSFQARLAVDPGFGEEPAAVMIALVPATRFDEVEGRQYTGGLLERFRAVPGVHDVGIISPMLLDQFRSSRTEFNVEGVEPPLGTTGHNADYAVVDAGFFGAAGVRIVAGRNFNDNDRADSPAVVIVSEALAQRFFSGEDPVDRRLSLGGDEVLVVGVASDANVRDLGEEARNFVYRPYSQVYMTFMRLVARTSRDPAAVGLELLAVAKAYDSQFWAWDLTTMERHIGAVAYPARVGALLLSVFATLAITLATIGLYGVVSYAVSQRGREIGIRMSLGADTATVVRMLMATGLRAVLVGGAAGLLITLVANRVLSGLLFGVSAFDPKAFLGAMTVLTLTALTATWLPARRVSRISPVSSLRSE